ncbi:unnamed protein product, partial [Laminaria digitata]
PPGSGSDDRSSCLTPASTALDGPGTEVPCLSRNLTNLPAAGAVLLEVPPIGAHRLPPQPPSLEAARSTDADVIFPSSELVAARLFDATLTPSPALSRLARLAGTLDQHDVA